MNEETQQTQNTQTQNPPAYFGGSTSIDRSKAFRSSRPQCLSGNLFPIGAILRGEITEIAVPKGAKFKTPLIKLKLQSGMSVQIPMNATIESVMSGEAEDEKEKKANIAACVGRMGTFTKMGSKKSASGTTYNVFDVVIE